MATADGRLRIVFNGEIYNFLELRASSRRTACAFASHSDTEVLLHGYRAWGDGLLDRLRGMFAFALHDAERGELFLARDPLGIKPLYFADDGGAPSPPRCRRCAGRDLAASTPRARGLPALGLGRRPATLYRGPCPCGPVRGCASATGLEPRVRAYWRLEDAFGSSRHR